MQKLCRIINWTFHKFCNWNWQGSSALCSRSQFPVPYWHCQRLWQLCGSAQLRPLPPPVDPLFFCNKAAAQNLWLAAFRLCFAAYYCYWHQQWHIRSAYSTPVEAHLLSWSRDGFSCPLPLSPIIPIASVNLSGWYRDTMALYVAYARIINIRKRKYIFYWPAAVFDYCPGHRLVFCSKSFLP